MLKLFGRSDAQGRTAAGPSPVITESESGDLRPASTTAGRLFRAWLFPLVIIALVVAPMRSSIADWNDVPSGSMRPTILEGDRITINKLAYGLRVPFTNTYIAAWSDPARGEIVTFASPLDGTRLVKRIVGMPGDRLAMHDNRLYVNGKMVEYALHDADGSGLLPSGESVNVILAEERLAGRSHAIALTPGVRSVRNFPEQVVPEGKYFMLGDNRDLSNDSRVYGTVPRENIYGRVSYVALSLDFSKSLSPRFERWWTAIR